MILAKSIEFDVTTLKKLPGNVNEDDMSVNAVSFFTIPKIPFGPVIATYKQEGTVATAYCSDRMKSYFGSRCWLIKLELSLVTWECIQ